MKNTLKAREYFETIRPRSSLIVPDLKFRRLISGWICVDTVMDHTENYKEIGIELDLE